MTQIRLTYFEGAGRAEPVRIALCLAKLPFEDRRLKFPEFAAMRAAGEFPLNSLPVLEVDGRAMVQTAAMLRFVARFAGTDLYPADARAGFVVDSVLDCFNDTLSHALTPSLFERDQEKKLEMRRAIVAGPLTLVLRYTERLAADSKGPFLTGETLTIADLVIGTSVKQYRSGTLDGIGPEVLEAYPRVRAIGDAFAAHPGIVAYGQRGG